MSRSKPSKPLLIFFCEGETEEEFYRKVFSQLGLGIRIAFVNLRGIRINNRWIAAKLVDILNRKPDNSLVAIIAYDREGGRDTILRVNIQLLRKQFQDETRILCIHEIIATQDLESWFFIDIDGIFRHLRVPKSKRVTSKFSNHESHNNYDLSALFRQFGKEYRKGHRVVGFLDQLNLKKIIEGCTDLKDGLELIKQKCT